MKYPDSIKFSIFIGNNIIERHQFLKKTIGSRAEEDYSYMSVIILMVIFPVVVVVCSVLEMIFYFLYNMKVL